MQNFFNYLKIVENVVQLQAYEIKDTVNRIQKLFSYRIERG